MTITITADHLHAASVHERALILDWLRTITDPARVASLKVDDDTVVTTEFLYGVEGLPIDRTERTYPVGPNCPHATLHDLWARLECEDSTAPDDDDYIDSPALGRTHPYGTGAP